MIKLRDDQQSWIDDIRSALRTDQSIMAQAPTGFGKTIGAAFMVKSAVDKGNDVIFSCHRRELIEQTSKSFELVGIRHGFIVAGQPANPHSKVKIASIQTLQNRLDKVKPPKLLLMDEGHHCSAAGWARVHKWAKDGQTRIVALSATPWRLSGDGLDTFFSKLVAGPTTEWLIEQGFLSDYRPFAPGTPDMSGVRKQAGDYAKGEVEQIMAANQLLGDAVRHYLKLARGKKCIAFCVSRKHSERLAERFREAGVSAIHLDGDTPKVDRWRAIKAFCDGHIDVLTNVDLFCEGFDLSALVGRDVPIECVSLNRPTMSLSLFLQQVGRGLRPKDKPAIILDHAGNFARHGFPDDPREWDLAPRKKQKKGESQGDGVPIKQCPSCYFIHRPTPACPNCGHVYAIQYREIEEVDGELGEIDVRARRAARKKEQDRARTLPDLVKLAKERGYKSPEKWAAKLFTGRAAARARYQSMRG